MAVEKISNIYAEKASGRRPTMVLTFGNLNENPLLAVPELFINEQTIAKIADVYRNDSEVFRKSGSPVNTLDDYNPYSYGYIENVQNVIPSGLKPNTTVRRQYGTISYAKFRTWTPFLTSGYKKVRLDNVFNFEVLNSGNLSRLDKLFSNVYINDRHERLKRIMNNFTINPNYTKDISSKEVTLNVLVDGLMETTGVNGREDPRVLCMSPATYTKLRNKQDAGTIKDKLFAIDETSTAPIKAQKFAHPLFTQTVTILIVDGLKDNYLFFLWKYSFINLQRPLLETTRYDVTIDKDIGNGAGMYQVACNHIELLQPANSEFKLICSEEKSGGDFANLTDLTYSEMETCTTNKKPIYDIINEKDSTFNKNTGIKVFKIKK